MCDDDKIERFESQLSDAESEPFDPETDIDKPGCFGSGGGKPICERCGWQSSC